MKRTIGFCVIVLLLICGNRLWAQGRPEERAPNGFPGQKLVDELFARHQPDLLYVGLYFVPPPSSSAAIWPHPNSSDQGGNEMVIVAATDRSTIGHKASCADMHVLTTDDSVLELNGDSGRNLELQAHEPFRSDARRQLDDFAAGGVRIVQSHHQHRQVGCPGGRPRN